MGRYRGPIIKICRREGINLVETPKAQKYMERRPYPPGEHGQRRRRRISDYGVRLREKQKLRFLYNMSEKQFNNLFEEASRHTGATGTVFLQFLESASTTWSIAWASPTRAASRASSSCTATSP